MIQSSQSYMISAVVLAKNEEENIFRCLRSISWCDEIILIDDYSEDSTVKIAKKLGAKVFKHHLKDNFAAQRNFGLKKAKGDWIFFIDADEVVSKDLADEIKTVVTQAKYKNIDGFYIKRKDFVFGKWLEHGEAGRMLLLRLGRKNAGIWKRAVHEIWQINGKVAVLNNFLLHYPHKNVAQFLTAINKYSTLHAKELAKEGRKSGFLTILFFPLGKFFRNFFWYQGFRDGLPGFLHALFMSFHSFLAQGKLWQIQYGQTS